MFALDILNQYQSENGNVLAAGKLFIYKQGRTELAEIYSDINGSVELANPVILNNLGMTDTPVYLSRLYSYTVVCKNMYGEELFSRDVYPNIDSDAGPAISGYLYEGISPIVVNNVDKAISAINVPIGVQEPLYFVEDSSAACIIGVYTSAISVSGYVTSGELATVSGEITAMIPSTAGLASEEYVNSSVSGKLDTTAFSTVSGSFLTAHQDLSNYATKDFVNDNIDSATSGLLPTSAYSDTSGNFILKSNSADIINEASALSTGWVSDQNYLVTNDITGKQDITGMTAYQAAGDYYSASNPSGFVTSGQLSTVSADITAMIPTALTGEYLDKASADTLYYGINNPSGFITGVDLTPYQTTAGMTAYAQNSALDDKLDASAFSTVSSTFLTAVPAGYATTGDVNDLAISISETYQVKGDYLTTSDSGNFYTTANESGFITNDAITGKQDITGMTAYQEAGNYYSASNPSGFITAVPTSYLQNTDLGITNNIITSISGLTIAGVEGDYELVPGNGIQLVDDPNERTTTISVSGDYATNSQLQTVSGEITALIPTALTGEYLDKASADTLYYPLNTNPSGYLVEDDITGKQDVSAMTAYVQNSAFTAQLTLSGGNGVSLVEDNVNNVLLINVTADGGDAEVNSLVHTNSADWNNVSSKEDKLIFSYTTANEISAINSSAIACSDDSAVNLLVHTNSATWDSVSGKLDENVYATQSGNFLTAVPNTYLQNTDLEISDNKITGISGVPLSAGSEFPASADEACALVTANSGTWDSVTGKQETLTFSYTNGDEISAINNSALAADPIPFEMYTISGTGAVDVYEQNNTLWISGKDFTNDITAKQDNLTFSYTTANEISAINSSAIAGGGEFPASADEACALVQTNSATWDGVTGKLDKTASANFYTTANPSGFMTSGQFKLYNYQVTGIVLNGVTRDIKAANSTYANTATNAEYDTNGNSLTALYDFIQNNSASWTGGGGGGSGSTSNIIYKQFGNGYGGSGIYLSGSGDVVFSVYAPNGISTITVYYPDTYTQDTVYFSPDYNQYNVYTALYTVTGNANPDLNVQDTSDWQISAGDMIIMNLNNAGFGVGSGSFVVNSIAYLTTGNIEKYDYQQGYYQQMTSWYDTLSDYQMSGATGQDNYAIHMNGDPYNNNYSWEISVKSLGGGNTGSTVTSADVLPATDGLDPYTTYTLKWSTYNGGLYWGT